MVIRILQSVNWLHTESRVGIYIGVHGKTSINKNPSFFQHKIREMCDFEFGIIFAIPCTFRMVLFAESYSS